MSPSAVYSGVAFFGFLCVVGALAIGITRYHRETFRLQFTIFLVAFVLRFATSVALYEYGLVDVIKDEDATGWVAGWALHDSWDRYKIGMADIPSLVGEAYAGQHQGYYYMLGLLFHFWDVGSPGRLVAAALNGFLGAFTVVLMYRTATVLFTPAIGTWVAWWTALFPSLIMWSAQTIKEPVVILLETAVLYACVLVKKHGLQPGPLIVGLASIVLLKPFRYYGMMIAAAAFLLSVTSPSRLGSRLPLRATFGVLASLVIVSVLAGSAAINEREAAAIDLEYVSRYRDWLGAHTASGVDTGLDMNTPMGFGLGTAIGAVHVLLAPFPWQWLGGSQRLLLTVPEVIVWWWLFYVGVIPGFKLAIKTRFHDIEPILLFICAFGLLYSMLFGNVGLAYRQRAQLLPWLFVFAALGLEQRRAERRAAAEAGDREEPVPAVALAVAARRAHHPAGQ